VLKRGLKAPSELVEKVGARERRKVKRTEKRGREAISDTERELCVCENACEETKICVFMFVFVKVRRKIVFVGGVKSNAYDVCVSERAQCRANGKKWRGKSRVGRE
jgi:hypothetical protein